MTSTAAQDISGLASRVLLIGWDAADWKIIRPLIAQGLMPHLASLRARGRSGVMHAGQPLLSPTIWTSIVSGQHPTRHGVLGSVEVAGDGCGLVPTGRAGRQAPAIWSLLDQAGIACHCINFPATHPAEPLHGVSVSNWFATHPRADGAVWPSDARESLISLHVKPEEIDAASLLTFVPHAAEIDPRHDPRVGQIAAILAQSATVHAATTWALEHVSWQFAAVCYSGLHQFSHGFMRYFPPRLQTVSERDFALYGQVITAAYRFHDMMLGRLLELAGPDANVMLVSDHGFRTDGQRPLIVSTSDRDMLAWHRPQGVCVLAGRAITPSADALAVTPFDIAPTILAILGFAPPPERGGRAVSGIVASEQLLPIQMRRSGGDFAEMKDGCENESIRYLRELGYVELPDAHAQFDAKQLANRRQFYLAVALLDARLPQRAVPLLEELVQRNQNDIENQIALARAYFDCRRTDDCRRLVDQALRIFPDSALAIAATGMLELAARRAKKAIDYFQLAEQKGVRSAELQAEIGRAYLKLQMFGDARRAFGRAIALDDELAEAYSGLGAALRGESNIDDAIAAHRKAISLAPCDARSHYDLGHALLKAGQLANARSALQNALHLDMNFAPALRRLADICRRQGQIMQAHEYDRVAHQAAGRRRAAEPDMAQPTAD
jgi:predicted AlkP superfamily phosphohydrolase/phosphomutase/tetratricopeptide (TPR) repeat protein